MKYKLDKEASNYNSCVMDSGKMLRSMIWASQWRNGGTLMQVSWEERKQKSETVNLKINISNA